ncbi:MAG: alpha/beta fold hydrolase [Spirochaetaceae bacterium]|nr:MAG: alpha/beta fold hydrolase [Spirochaetaceae bacterium]
MKTLHSQSEEKMNRTAALVLATAGILVAGVGAEAADVYEDPRAGFTVPSPAGWQLTQEHGYARFSREGVDAEVFVVAAPGSAEQVNAAAIQLLIDSELGAEFIDRPLQASPIQLASGTWTQRIYQRDDKLIASISMERDGMTSVVVTEATQAEFIGAVNAAVNAILMGFEFREGDQAQDDTLHLRHDVTFDSGSIPLAGTLTLPEADGPHPAVILISGSGAQDRDGRNPALPRYRPMRWIADNLAAHGIATLRFDERGIGESQGDHLTATTADLADDNEAALRYLLARPEIDPERIGLLGHSEGGVIAAMVAARNPDVAFVINMAGSAVPYSEVVVRQVELIAKASGLAADEVAVMRERQIQAMEHAEAGEWEKVREIVKQGTLEQIARLPEAQAAALGDPNELAGRQADAEIAGMKTPWMQFFMSYDPRPDWQRITVPVLAVFGGLDTQVDAAQNRPALEAALRRAGNRDVTVRIVEDANHLFQKACTGSPEEYAVLGPGLHDEFLEIVTGWISERFGR